MSHTQEIIARHDNHLIQTYGRYPIALVRGQGVELWDAEGKRYLDLFAGFGGPILGHCHPELVEAMTRQAQTLWHVGNLFHTEPQTLLAEQIGKLGFGGRSFFCHGGADANEAAIKIARLHGGANPGPMGPRFEIITAIHSFHGRTMGAMMATGQDKVRLGFEPWPAGFNYVPFNDLEALEVAITPQTAAIMLEPIQGEGGVNIPDNDYLPAVRRLCDERKILMICDEVWTGCGRTGRWFAHQHWDIEPDVMTLAKGIGGGLAVGAMCAKPAVAALFDWRKHGRAVHGLTLGGNCVSMAVATRIFQIMQRDRLVQRAAQLGRHAVQRLQRFSQTHPAIKSVRGKGLFMGIELDPAASGGAFTKAADVVNACLRRGLIINATQDLVLRLAPALTITQPQLDEGLAMLESALTGE